MHRHELPAILQLHHVGSSVAIVCANLTPSWRGLVLVGGFVLELGSLFVQFADLGLAPRARHRRAPLDLGLRRGRRAPRRVRARIERRARVDHRGAALRRKRGRDHESGGGGEEARRQGGVAPAL